MQNGKGERKKADMKKTGGNYEVAISEAFNEIFQNLTVIEKDTKRQREMLSLERRRGSAPAEMLRQTTAFLPTAHTVRKREERRSASSVEETTTAIKQQKLNLERRRGSSPSGEKLLTPPYKRAVYRVNSTNC